MGIDLTFTDLTPDQASVLVAYVSKPAKGKPAKTTKPAPEEEEETFGEEETTTEEEDSFEDTEEDGPTLAVVMDAFKKFIKKHKGDKSKAIPILKKFKVKSPNDLEESDYPAVLKLLK
jgi:hypothetical protein